SIPEQNPRPSPVMTTALTAMSEASAAHASVNSVSMTPLMALSLSGRFSRNTATPGWSVSRISVWDTSYLQEAGAHVGRRQRARAVRAENPVSDPGESVVQPIAHARRDYAGGQQ